jgi:predicted nucleic acid-binding protein
MTIDRPFWDTSAVVPLCCRQSPSSAMRRLLRAHSRMVAWWGTVVEAHGAFSRLLREGAFTEKERTQALYRLAALRRSWFEVQPVERVRSLAEAMLDRSDLRSADVLQLAAALVACNEKPRKRAFVCLDERLAAAARQAGFVALP